MEPRERVGRQTILRAAALYAAVYVAMAWKVLRHFATVLPMTLTDPLQHLWILRWYETCLLSGRFPYLSDQIQYPTGAPLGLFSPLHLQAALFVLLRPFTQNDVLRYNLIWTAGWALAAVAGFFLSWKLVRSRVAAVYGGLLGLLSTPIVIHAGLHLELIFVGSFAFFFWAWLEFLERPERKTLFLALASYVFLTVCAAYYAVMATIPAGLLVARHLLFHPAHGMFRRRAAWREKLTFLRSRTVWLTAFGVLAAIVLALLFGAQLWSRTHGFSGARSKIEFARYWTPIWAYVAPTWAHRAAAIFREDPYVAAGFGRTIVERASYLGVVPLLLLAVAAFGRVPLRRRLDVWLSFGVCVALSLGAYRQWGHYRVPLPAEWFFHVFPPMRELRVPARFNLFAVVLASVLAAAAFAWLLAKIERPLARRALVGAVFALTIVDLLPRPYRSIALPRRSTVYEEILARDPKATFLEAPDFGTRGFELQSVLGYWRSLRTAGPTSAGYSGFLNTRLENLRFFTSPVWARRLAIRSYLRDPEDVVFDVYRGDARDYLWAYLDLHGFRYLVVHRDPRAWPELAKWVNLSRLLPLLEPALVLRQGSVDVYAADLLPRPRQAVAIATEGFHLRETWQNRWCARLGERAEIAFYNPTSEVPVGISLGLASFRTPRTATLALAGESRAILTAAAPPRDYRMFAAAPRTFPAGWSTLVLRTRGTSEIKPERREWDYDPRPFSLRISAIRLASGSLASDPVALQSPR